MSSNRQYQNSRNFKSSMRIAIPFAVLAIVVLFSSCKKDEPEEDDNGATPYNLVIPNFFPPMDIPSDNPLTVEGVELGRFLFYEELLSGDNSQSCADCHAPEFAFSDPRRFSIGIDGTEGTRNSMALVNLGWGQFFFWDGRAATLEDQIFEPVVNPIEMNDTWPNVVNKLMADDEYPARFMAAFGTDQIDSVLVSKAIAQFLRTLISAGSKFDRFRAFETTLTLSEQRGLSLIQLEGGDPNVVPGGQNGADCFHCHGFGDNLFTDNQLHNNGLDSIFTDLGAGGVTGNASDMGRFKTPTLRNIEFTAPYMHDGRFETLEEVIEHYDSGGHPSPTIDPFMKYTYGGLTLPDSDKQALVDFLKTLSDYDFINNPDFQDPN